jgi:hypothetical protein
MQRTPATVRALSRAVGSSPVGTKSATPSFQFLQRYARHASSSVDPAPRAAAAATQSASSAASTSHAATAMPWDAYFKLRKSRKNWGTVAAIPTTLTGVFGGGGQMRSLSRLLIPLLPPWTDTQGLAFAIYLQATSPISRPTRHPPSSAWSPSTHTALRSLDASR